MSIEKSWELVFVGLLLKTVNAVQHKVPWRLDMIQTDMTWLRPTKYDSE
jgi:hypothetical protein